MSLKGSRKRVSHEVGLPTTLEELDVEATPENVMTIADTVVNNNKLIYAEPFKITLDFVYNSIMAADAMGLPPTIQKAAAQTRWRSIM